MLDLCHNGSIVIGHIDTDGHYKFYVGDNGPGIEKKHYKRIFQMFQTLNSQEETESTGVGLAIVKKILQLYSGEIWVESVVGIGSTFFFTLPKSLPS